MKNRTNAEWLDDLTSGGELQEDALDDLRQLLLQAARLTLNRSLEDGSRFSRDIDALAEDCAQEALLSILSRLSDFRGESKFTTWAYKFAVNIALTTARRKSWKHVSLDALLEESAHPLLMLEKDPDPACNPELVALQGEVWATISRIIREHLTPRQRQVLILMVFHEVPMDVVVERFGSNRNAIYKLLHDARLKLKNELARVGFGVEAALQIIEMER